MLTECSLLRHAISPTVWETEGAGGRGVCPSERKIEGSLVNHLVINLTAAETCKGAADKRLRLCRRLLVTHQAATKRTNMRGHCLEVLMGVSWLPIQKEQILHI